ncbi:MAG: lipid-A-disaccharide synthase [Methylophilaceae bacterium]|nr:lipid-A-disaccharide synthase [Methylophilaceae bacterium]MDG1444727.1 lipid-A-disaccharide synthase [Methylophilaceae bacterium]MDG2293511.1 lipid-A-disaccharide synthase [Methylophilaceae bacterium]
MPKIAIVAGEASGDLLGAHLIQALKKERKDLSFIGIAGPKMMSEGVQSLYPMERLSVRGYLEVVKHLWGLLKLRRSLLQQILAGKPDVFIGIDAPDFNFWLERKLKKQGIPTIHYVSPSIWAWRGGRIHKIKRAVTHLLALFPFEPALYDQVDLPVTYVGHPLADALPLKPNQKAARDLLKLRQDALVIAMLPGSRQSEVQQHADFFVKTAELMNQHHPMARFIVPLITRETRDLFEKALAKSTDDTLKMKLLFSHAHDAMEAADFVVVASGTATLEAALLKKPMIITYRMPTLSWWLLKPMHYLPFVGLPNVLANRFVVPELLQKEATPEKLNSAMSDMLADVAHLKAIKQVFTDMHRTLKQNSAKKAAEIVISYLP